VAGLIEAGPVAPARQSSPDGFGEVRGIRNMTAVGKILVFLNLVFSFVVGALAVMDYTARTHWATNYKKLEDNFKVSEASKGVYKGEADKLTKERDEYNQALYREGKKELMLKDEKDTARAATEAIALLRSRTQEVEKLRKDIKDRDTELVRANAQVKEFQAATTVAQTDAKRRQADVEKLRETLNAETTRITKLVADMNTMRDQRVAAEIKSKSVQDVNNRLETQLQDMARDLVRLRSSGGRTAGTSTVSRRVNPPNEDVEGLVKRAEGNLVTLSIGSDAGLTKGNTLEVFRFGTNPRYIGRVKIVEVSATTAVGQVQGRVTSPIQAGDTVASNIMKRR